MKRMWFALLVMMFLASYAVAQSIYVFPADGFRYQQEEGEIVLTRTNLEQYSDLITQLGTTTDAVRASFDASRIAMEVIMPDGGQIAISTSPADADSDAVEMADLDETQQEALRQRFSDSGLYQDCVFSKNASDWIRMTSSAMYGSMPVWQLRYVTLHSGGYLILNSTIIGREPAGADDDTERSDRGDISHDKGKLCLRCPLAVYCCDGGSETNRASHLCQLTVYLEDISRYDLPPESGIPDTTEEDKPSGILRHREERNRSGLSHRLDDQNARHHRIRRKMPHELQLIGTDAPYGVRTLSGLAVRHLVNHKKRITMRKDLLNLSAVKLHQKTSLVLVKHMSASKSV